MQNTYSIAFIPDRSHDLIRAKQVKNFTTKVAALAHYNEQKDLMIECLRDRVEKERGTRRLTHKEHEGIRNRLRAFKFVHQSKEASGLVSKVYDITYNPFSSWEIDESVTTTRFGIGGRKLVEKTEKIKLLDIDAAYWWAFQGV